MLRTSNLKHADGSWIVRSQPAPWEVRNNAIVLSEWRIAFAAVLFETDKSAIKSRIEDASRAIGEQLQSLGAEDGIERISLEAAQRSLEALERQSETPFVPEPLENSIPIAGSDSSSHEVERIEYGIGSQVFIMLPSGALTAADIVVIFTASSGKNILVSFDKRFLRIGPEQILRGVNAKGNQVAATDDFTIVLKEPRDIESCGIEAFEGLNQFWTLVQRYGMKTPLSIDVIDCHSVCIQTMSAVRDSTGKWHLKDERPAMSPAHESKPIAFPLILNSKDASGNILKVRVQVATNTTPESAE